MPPFENGYEPTMRILVIDDDPEMGRLIKKFLSREDYRVETALNGSDGLLLIQQKAFDLVISDLKMPGMSGFELIRKARAVAPDTPFILITAFGHVKTYIDAMDAGVFEYINKPIKLKDLRLIVRIALQVDALECKIQ